MQKQLVLDNICMVHHLPSTLSTTGTAPFVQVQTQAPVATLATELFNIVGRRQHILYLFKHPAMELLILLLPFH